jgi:hypothetical protein
MTTPSATSSPTQPNIPSTSSTQPIPTSEGLKLAEQSFSEGSSDQAAPLLPTSTGSAVARTAEESTLPVPETVRPSMRDVLATPFVDMRTLGVETWPLGGLRRWEGEIVDIDGGIFTAELTSLDLESDAPKLRADFRMDVIEAPDHTVAVGDLFYLTSQKVRARGILRTAYTLQLRRAGKWTAADIEDIHERAQQRLEALGEDLD